ncbi:MAG: acetyl-CoA C-acetyltransferase [Acidimicrobiales bacterium]|jgi:acetyl-CoA C-acetyltransferase|nr:acetyl-CoA C-acyltransferase [Acidimicrobiaceae bacterium]MBJ46216.1 acetyl-CoA C-acyltransferase [Acidimicrobiaceae bacterium]MBR14449.1 acetyl-CoA C-acyltransferase [Acidimicrobiaceae bacterium]MEC7714598.1 acetyl-CoA C-acetyltransferase [Actinomycetota bacterium]|tara:strand:+ start:14306 stop:15508 length:1203 start_codon:yes stop_codon:yes gene_type:complete
MAEPVIVATSRTPIGRASKGSLVDARPDDMSAFIVKDVLGKVDGLDPAEVEDIIWGIGQPGGEGGFNIGRIIAVMNEMEVPGVTVNRYCSSSLQTIRMAAHAIKAGEGDCFVAGGVETVSRYMNGAADTGPHNELFADAEQRSAERTSGESGKWEAPNGLPDVYIAMGQTAENVAEHLGISRERQDEFGVRSQNLAEAAMKRGFFEQEITPYTLPDGSVVSKDDGIREGTTLEGVSQLNPVFRPGGTITAGNACPLNDGAAAVVVMSDTRAKELGLQPLARIVASGVSALNPEIMGLGPIDACRQVLDRAGMEMSDIDLVEINEAFAVQVLGSADALGIDIDEQLNINGGAIALGHPFGMTGSRIMTTLINSLHDADKQFGLETMCVGGGQGMAMLIERL